MAIIHIYCCPLRYSWTSLVTQLVKNLSAMWEAWVQSLGWEDPLEKGKATHSSTHGQRSLEGYSPWGHKESDLTEWLTSDSIRINITLPAVVSSRPIKRKGMEVLPFSLFPQDSPAVPTLLICKAIFSLEIWDETYPYVAVSILGTLFWLIGRSLYSLEKASLF